MGDQGLGGGMDQMELKTRAMRIIERHLAQVSVEALHSQDFANGKVFVQHCKAQLAGVKEAALRLAHEANADYRSHVDSMVNKGKMKAVDSPRLFGFFTRYFCENENPDAIELKSLSWRLMSIDFDDGTEWGQGYYVFGAAKGSASSRVCVNPGEAAAAWEARMLRESIGKGDLKTGSFREAPRL